MQASIISFRTRRNLIAAAVLQALAGRSVGQASGTGTAVPISPLRRPREAFEATTAAAVQAALGAPQPIPGIRLRLDVPDIATQAGAVVVRVDTTMIGVTQVAILAHRAPFPLAALLRPDGALGPYEVVVAVDRTSRITALVQADGKWYSVSREVKVAAQSW